MPSLGTLPVRVATAVTAVAIAGGLALYPMVRAGSLVRLTVLLEVISLLLVLMALTWPGRMTGPALFVLAGEYLIVEVAGRVPTVTVIVYAVGLVVLPELLFFRGRLPSSGGVDPRVIVEHLLHLGAIGLGAAVTAALVLVVGGWRTFGALEAGLIGMTAAVLLGAIPVVLLRRSRP